MRCTILFLGFLLMFCTLALSQNSGNPHFFKLLIMNQKQEILLIDFDGSWEIPGSCYKMDSTIPVFLDEMALDHGVKIQNDRLVALVTFHHEVRDLPTMMFYYTADYFSGNLKTPSWGRNVQWFKLQDAYEIIPFKEMVHIIKSIQKQNDLLSGALKIKYDQNGKRTGEYEVLDALKD
ncbi:MAG: hypothetical protein WBG46_13530 [Nonlabens sp.]